MAFEGLTLKKQKVHPTPPRGSKLAGEAAHRIPKQLHERQAQQIHTEWAKKTDPETGEPIRNPLTGEEEYEYEVDERTGRKLYRRRRLVNDPSRGIVNGVSAHKVQFYFEDQGNGNARKVRYTPPSPEEIARRNRREQAKDFLPNLVDRMLALGLSEDQVAERLARMESIEADVSARGQTTESKPEPIPEPDYSQYPIHKGGGRWEMVDGTIWEGGKDSKAEAVKINEKMVARMKEVRELSESLPEL